MRTDFYIFRHGETDYNKERRWQGCGIDADLNAEGILQAKTLADRLQPCGLEYIYSSNLQRALHTAQIVASRLHIGVEIVPALREGCFGKAEGMLKSDIAVQYADIYQKWYSRAEDMNLRFPGGESKAEMQERMFGALESLLEKPYRTVGIASHGSSIRYLLYKFGMPPHAMANGALFHLVHENNTWRLCA